MCVKSVPGTLLAFWKLRSDFVSYFGHSRGITPPRRGILAENCVSYPSRSY